MDDLDTDLMFGLSFYDHLKMKWRKFFQFFDFDGDGNWTSSDFAKLADKMVLEADHLMSDIGAVHIRKHCKHWLTMHEEELCGLGSGEITEEVIVNTMDHLFKMKKRNRQQLKELDLFCEVLFEILDINRDGKLSKQDVKIFYCAMGIRNISLIEKMFSELDIDGDGTVMREEFRIAYRGYFFGDQRTRNKYTALLFDKDGLQ